jgi:hypothetical protein
MRWEMILVLALFARLLTGCVFVEPDRDRGGHERWGERGEHERYDRDRR